MQVGIIGFAGAGRSTIFTALSGLEPSPGGAALSHRSVATVQIPDERLLWLKDLYRPKKYTPATMEFVDFAGIPRSAEKGKAELFGKIRDSEALLLVVSAFDGAADASELPGAPEVRIRALLDELLFADLEIVERRIERLAQNLQKGVLKTRDRDQRELELMQRCQQALEAGESLLDIARNKDDQELLQTYRFLQEKPRIAVINASEEMGEMGEKGAKDLVALEECSKELGLPVHALLGQVEAEIAVMPEEERALFLAEYGLEQPARDAIIQAASQATRSIPFFTVGEDEVRAWLIQEGDTALDAAGKVHSDIARGFIRAEVNSFEELTQAGSMKEVKARNQMRLEGKDYRVKNGEIVHFRFSV